MNKISNEERVRIFAAYWDAEIAVKNSVYKMTDIHGFYDPSSIGLIKDGNPTSRVITDCQLLLRDLSSITDEDAIELARIIVPLMFVNTKKGWIVSRDFTVTGYPYVKIHHPKKVWSVQIDVQLVNFDVDGMEERCTGENDMKPVAVIDFLRSKGYNIGYGSYSPQDLIDNGIVKG